MDKIGADHAGVLPNGQSKTVNSTTSGALDRQDSPRAAGTKDEGPNLINGDVPLRQYDGSTDAQDEQTLNGVAATPAGQAVAPSSLLELPPEIRHVTQGYHSLGKLMSRSAQLCYNDLVDNINKMAEMHVPQQVNGTMPNGINNHVAVNGAGDNSENNTRKKIGWLEFANQHRERFIRMLVLSDWSRKVGDLGKLIDLKVWNDNVQWNYNEAQDSLAELKFSMEKAPLPNPDIKTAFEVLSTSKAPWMPDLGYIPPEPLSPEQMLKTLRHINTILSIRLNLHENLPRHLKDWSISSGRATFVIPSEFELDVSIADEDPSSQFFFIDVRFLFTPAPDLPDGFVRSQIEGTANHALIKSGLSGCYDLLHDFVLTHKIQILRKQAFEMGRGAWADSIRVESVHRSLIVQYWTEKSGSKSWIEIGIASGKARDGTSSWKDAPVPRVAVNWHRNGVEVKGLALSIDWANLSMERILKQIIALHIGHMLGTLRDQLQTPSKSKRVLATRLDTSDSEPADCVLKARLRPSTSVITVTINPITGRLALQPSTPTSDYYEREINKPERLASDAHMGIVTYLCVDRQQSVERAAERCGWKLLKNLNLRLDHIKTTFGREISRYSVFRAQDWGSSNWTIVASLSSGGESWWAVHLNDPSVGESIKAVIPLEVTTTDKSQAELSQTFLQKVERLAIAEICFNTIANDLKKMNVPHSLQRETLAPHETKAAPSAGLGVTVPTLYIRFSYLMKAGSKLRPENSSAAEMLRLTHHGFEKSQGKVVHLVKGVFTQPKDFVDIVKTTHDDDVVFHPSGSFAILLRTSFGTSCISQLVARLRAIERTRTFAGILKKQNLSCEKISLARIAFSYADKLTADIGFAEGAPISVTFTPDNPHRRVRAMLSKILNNPADGFENFTKALSISLPILRAFGAIEQKTASSVISPVIHPRSVDWYRMTYHNPPCSFEIRLRLRKEALEWHIELNKPKQDESPLPEQFEQALKGLFQAQGQGWIGIVSTIVADIHGVRDALVKLDELVRGFDVVEEAAASTTVKSEQPEVVVLD